MSEARLNILSLLPKDYDALNNITFDKLIQRFGKKKQSLIL